MIEIETNYKGNYSEHEYYINIGEGRERSEELKTRTLVREKGSAAGRMGLGYIAAD